MRRVRSTLAVLIVSFAFAFAAHAQYFGRNKVQWERFDFQVVETEHFTVHFYPEDNQAALDASRMAERWYDRLAPVFGQLPDKTPIILYNDQGDFRQTTVVGGLIGEGVGGFTEPLRSRLVMPVTGIYEETDHVVGHEMVHVFQFAIAQSLGRNREVGLSTMPLYLVEGLAEYLSLGGRHPQTAMFLRDAFVHEELPEKRELERMRLSPYRFGHAFWAYVAGRWGDRKAIELFVAALTDGPDAAFERVLGTKREELWSDWRQAIAAGYRDQIARREPPGEEARSIFPPREGRDEKGPIYIAPALSPDGRRVAFLSSRDLFGLDLYVADVATGKIERKLTSTRSDPHFDAIRFLDSAGAWSPDGEKFCVVVFDNGDNHLAILDVDSGDVERRLRIPGVGALSDPAWSPDGRQLAVSGAENGLTDLFLIDVASGDSRRLTRDKWADLQPAWSPDGRRLAWVTDRGPDADLESLRYAPTQIALLDVPPTPATGDPVLVPLFDKGDHTNPQFSPDGRTLYFLADPDGVRNVFAHSLERARTVRLTNVYSGVCGITDLSPALSVAAKDGTLAFSAFVDSRYLLYRIDPRGLQSRLDDSERSISERPKLSSSTRGSQRDQRIASLEGAVTAGLPPEAEDEALTEDAAVLPPIDRRERDVVARYLDVEAAPPEREETRPYHPRLALLHVGTPVIGTGVDSVYGLGLSGGVSAYLGDTLGRHQLGVSFEGAVSSDDFASGFGGVATYLNQAHRWNWGVSAGRVPYVTAFTNVSQEVIEIDGEPVVADVVQQVRERVVLEQVGLLTQYPLSQTQRFEAGAFVARQQIDRELETAFLVGDTVFEGDTQDLASPSDLDLGRGYVAFVRDSAAYGFTGPLAGTRFRLEAGSTTGTLQYQTALADYRRYIPFRPASFAVRALHYGRYGGEASDPRLAPLFVGGETLVRGYAEDSFSPSECTTGPGLDCPEFDRLVGDRIGVVNMELRLQVLGAGGYGLANAPYFPLELAGFVDVGAAWDEDTTVELEFDRDSIERVPVVSVGLAARMLIAGYLPIEVYAAHPLHRHETDVEYGFLITQGW